MAAGGSGRLSRASVAAAVAGGVLLAVAILVHVYSLTRAAGELLSAMECWAGGDRFYAAVPQPPEWLAVVASCGGGSAPQTVEGPAGVIVYSCPRGEGVVLEVRLRLAGVALPWTVAAAGCGPAPRQAG